MRKVIKYMNNLNNLIKLINQMNENECREVVIKSILAFVQVIEREKQIEVLDYIKSVVK